MERMGTKEIESDVFAAHLRLHAGRYFSDGKATPAQVRLVGEEERPASRLYRFAVWIADQEKTLLVKVPFGVSPHRAQLALETRASDRPRLMPVADPQRKFIFEYSALSRIHDHFGHLNDPRFGTIRIFELLPQHGALIMELVMQPSLRQLAMRQGRWPSMARRTGLQKTFEHAGAWLREYHGISTLDPVESLQTEREDFVRFVQQLSSFLASNRGDASFFGWVARQIAVLAREWLPEVLPLGLAHGDFAMRNILVGPAQRVTVLDTLGRYRISSYCDIGYFLADLQCSWPAALGRGAVLHRAWIAHYRRAFLTGYFGKQTIPEQGIRLYETQSLLERWASVIARCSPPSERTRAVVGPVKLAIVSAFFRWIVRERLLAVKAASLA